MNVFLFIVILLVLILVHELGHFIVAKLSKIRVDEFGVGFPPRALTLWRKGETSYTLNWLPFGGFVKIFGEDFEDKALKGADKKRAFISKPKSIQALVLVAGVAMNVFLAWVLFSTAFVIGVPTALSGEEQGSVTDERLVITTVLPNSPAEKGGLQSNDVILSIESQGERVGELTPDAVTDFIVKHNTEEIAVKSARGGEEITTVLSPLRGLIPEEPERPAIGIGMGLIGTLHMPLSLAALEAAQFTGEILGKIVVSLFVFFVSAFTLTADLTQITGPVGIVGLVGDAASFGLASLLMFTAFISLNLAIINLLPIPALDGGRLLFVGIEFLKGSPIKPSVARTLNTLGFAFLILLMVAVTYGDVLKLLN